MEGTEFAYYGEPVMIPGSMGSSSYLFRGLGCPARTDLKGRTDILRKWEESVRAEAPYAYKDINEVIAVHKAHDMAALVARLEPIFTVKS